MPFVIILSCDLMPIDIAESINAIADKFLNAPLVLTIAKNPIYTALCITAVIVLIILITFRDSDDLTELAGHAAIWVFLTTLVLTFLNNRVLLHDINDHNDIADYNRLFTDNIGASEQNFGINDALVQPAFVQNTHNMDYNL